MENSFIYVLATARSDKTSLILFLNLISGIGELMKNNGGVSVEEREKKQKRRKKEDSSLKLSQIQSFVT